MSSAAIRARCTPEEYLVLERRAEFRHEYRDGIITAMAGTSREHSLIQTNLSREISTQLRHQPCEVHGDNLRVAVTNANLYTYPDLTIVCGEPRFLDGVFDTPVNPTVLVEVLSPSTEADDRGEKFARYRRLESLREYVLVAQDRARVERFTKRGDRVAADRIRLAGRRPAARVDRLRGPLARNLREGRAPRSRGAQGRPGRPATLREAVPMPPRGVLETAVYATDLEAAEAFYAGVLSLAVLSREPGRHVFFRCGAGVFLVFNPESTARDVVRVGDSLLPRHGATGPGHAAFRVAEAEIPSWRDRLARAGVAIESEIQWPGGGHSLYVRDPAGNSIELATAALWGLPEPAGEA
jgi:Uma2 family endonuclease/catechol 2,3-dioxygenase-like lactoylglutathione lyase family enzyme